MNPGRTIRKIHARRCHKGTGKMIFLANVPYVPGCGCVWPAVSEQERLNLQGKFKGDSGPLLARCRVVYDYYSSRRKIHILMK